MLPRIGFLIDAQLPPRLAQQLTAAGYPSIHIHQLARPTAPDADIARLANEAGLVMMSKDEDFLDLLRRNVLHTGLVWIRLGNLDPTRLWVAIERDLPAVLRRLEAGEKRVEIPCP